MADFMSKWAGAGMPTCFYCRQWDGSSELGWWETGSRCECVSKGCMCSRMHSSPLTLWLQQPLAFMLGGFPDASVWSCLCILFHGHPVKSARGKIMCTNFSDIKRNERHPKLKFKYHKRGTYVKCNNLNSIFPIDFQTFLVWKCLKMF